MTSGDRRATSQGVRDSLREFLDAFECLDLDRFLACWGKGATVIHPIPEMPRRLDGWDEVRDAWRAVFDYMRATRSGPRYLDLQPLDLDVRMVGVGAAVASFHLGLVQSLG